MLKEIDQQTFIENNSMTVSYQTKKNNVFVITKAAVSQKLYVHVIRR